MSSVRPQDVASLNAETGHNTHINARKRFVRRIEQLLSEPGHACALYAAGEASWHSKFRLSPFRTRLTGALDRWTGGR